MTEFSIHADLAELADAVADRCAAVIRGAQANDGLARLVVTGGGAGIASLTALAEVDGIDWSRVLIFFGDERFVPADDPERNEGQARDALLDRVGVPEEHIFAIASSDGEFGDDPDAAAAAYTESIAKHAPDGFDLHLMGMGGEGHVNSLFPHAPALKAAETAVAVRDCPKQPPTRVTLTPSTVATADRIWLLVAGEAKAKAVAAIAAGADPADWPAAGAKGRRETIVFADQAAASLIPR